MEKIKLWIDKSIDVTVNVLMVFLLIITSAQVFWRYVLNSPIAWSEELARYTFVWLVFLGGCTAFRENKHMAVDLLPNILSPALRKIQEAIVKILIAVFLIALLMISPEIIQLTMDQPSASLDIPIAFLYVAFPASAFIMLLDMGLDVILGWKRRGEAR